MQKVLYNQGTQSLVWTPIGPQGRVVLLASAPTFVIEDLRYGEESSLRSVNSGTATLDTVSTTVSGNAGAGQSDPRWIPLTSVTGIQAGHRYQVSNGNGYPETVDVVDVRATPTAGIVVSVPLRGSFVATDPFVGVEYTASFLTGTADDETRLHDGAGPFMVVFDFDLDGRAVLALEEVWLTRYSLTIPITESEVLLASPILASRISGADYSAAQAIVIATEDTMGELHARRVDVDYFRNGPFMKRAVRAKALEYLYRWSSNGDDHADRHADEWMRLISQLTNNTRPGSVEIGARENTAPPGSSTTRNGFLARS